VQKEKTMSQTEVVYWMVHRSSLNTHMLPPTKSHASKKDAIAEAQRLARQNPGIIFNVLIVQSAYCFIPSGSPVVPVQSVCALNESAV
jgi:hypothetical protein